MVIQKFGSPVKIEKVGDGKELKEHIEVIKKEAKNEPITKKVKED